MAAPLSPRFFSPPSFEVEPPKDPTDAITEEWGKMAEALPCNDCHHRMRSIRQMARHILQQIDQLNLSSSEKARLQKQAFYFVEQLELSAETFCKSQQQFQKEQDEIRQKFNEMDENFSRMTPPTSPIFPDEEALPLWSQVQKRLTTDLPQVDRPESILSRWSVERKELLGRVFCNAEKDDMQDVAIVAKVLEGANEAVLWGTKKVCGLHPAISSVCSQGKELVLEGAKIVNEHTPEFVKTKVNRFRQMRREAIEISAAQAERRCGISREESINYHDNLATVGVEFSSFLGGVGASKALTLGSKILPKITKTIPSHLQDNLASTLLRSDIGSLLQDIPPVVFSKQTFQELAKKANPRVNIEHLTYYKGMGRENFVLRIGKGEHSVVIKVASAYEALFESQGSQFFNTLNLKNLHFSSPISVVKQNNNLVLVKPHASGQTLDSWIGQYAQGKIPFETVTEALGQLGKAYNELQVLSQRHGISPSQFQKNLFFNDLLETLNSANSALKKFNQPLIVLSDAQITTFSRLWQQTQIFTGFGLGDVGLTNFAYSQTTKRLFYIDGESLAYGINRMGQPVAILEHDISMLVSDLIEVSIGHGMSAKDAQAFLTHFFNQLQKPVHPFPILNGKIDAVHQIFEGISLGKKPDLKEVEKLVQQTNEYIQLMQW